MFCMEIRGFRIIAGILHIRKFLRTEAKNANNNNNIKGLFIEWKRAKQRKT